MITEDQKFQIGRLLQIEAKEQGSWPRLAIKLGVNEPHLRYNMIEPEKWHNVSDKMWTKVAKRLGYKLNEVAWALVPTTNTIIMEKLLDKAQNEQLFMAVSHNAGQGKTAGVMMYKREHEGVFYVECEESWGHKRFVQKIAEELGLRTENYTISVMTDMITARLLELSVTTRPLLIIDEANKLQPSSLRFFIPLFNKVQDEVGMVLIGAHDLKKHIQSGVQRDARGFDELESRLGRAYMALAGIYKNDVEAICTANGVPDKAVQEKIWTKMIPERKTIGGQVVWVSAQDLRVLKQAIKYYKSNEQDGKNLTPTELETTMGANVERKAA